MSRKPANKTRGLPAQPNDDDVGVAVRYAAAQFALEEAHRQALVATKSVRATTALPPRVMHMDHAGSAYTHEHDLAHCAECEVIYCKGCSMQWGSTVSQVVDHTIPRNVGVPAMPPYLGPTPWAPFGTGYRTFTPTLTTSTTDSHFA